MHWIS
jgi:hypothetical protein